MKTTLDLPRYPELEVSEHEDEFGIIHLLVATRIPGFVKAIDNTWSIYSCPTTQKATYTVEEAEEAREKVIAAFNRRVVFSLRFYKPSVLIASEPLVGAHAHYVDVLIEAGVPVQELESKLT